MPHSRNSKTPETVSRKKAPRKARVIRDLGIFGFDHIEPVILAALITEEPMLLIGQHGTAKSLLMTRISEALGLEFRHYNASLINFDDLIGFPVPSDDGQLKYVQTPATIWQAETVIFDEISRCQPEMQNKLFPLVHERKVQGLDLANLRYRWAAMNPPADEGDDSGYIGSEPLDSALADRFIFVVKVPTWKQLGKANQRAIIAGEGEHFQKQSADMLQDCIAKGRTFLSESTNRLGRYIVEYVQALIPLLAEAGLECSPRRARMFHQAILATHAATMSTVGGFDPAETTLLAVSNALPQRAEGISVPEGKLLAAHREAWACCRGLSDSAMAAILGTQDHRKRVRLALESPNLTRDEFSTVVSDAYAALEPGAREALVVCLFDADAVGRLNAPVAEQMAEVYAGITESRYYRYRGRRIEENNWGTVANVLSRPRQDDKSFSFLENALLRHYFAKRRSPDIDQFPDAWTSTIQDFSGTVT
ncbi:MAG: AAA family ATPase [Gammaproteobacteria bacterium]|nr:AAA family ATPase [Gammaproteobacteria bacterium]